jgi:hypothetical protein
VGEISFALTGSVFTIRPDHVSVSFKQSDQVCKSQEETYCISDMD